MREQSVTPGGEAGRGERNVNRAVPRLGSARLIDSVMAELRARPNEKAKDGYEIVESQEDGIKGFCDDRLQPLTH